MPYVQRDGSNNIIGLFANLQPGRAEEFLAEDNAEVIAYQSATTIRIVPTSVLISRFTSTEYADLLQKRVTAITGGNVTLVKQWDTAVARGTVNLNSPATQTFKAALVSANVLTQNRADAIFVV